ncbi:polysaccharide deacetylase family protein [Micromonospora sp. NPDC049645]|uniref:polysaccharide deacetylase family protein n=1 Tax=Micromonospora sp. NPDC049645 TaxID=3155508 RepID=UPI00342E5841
MTAPADFFAIAWSADGYEVAEVADGRLGPGQRRFAFGPVDALAAALAADRPTASVVVESTNGILDGQLMARGHTVFGLDADHLPARPTFGSVDAAQIALAALREPAALRPLDRRRGTQTGREDRLEAGIAQSREATERLARSGACLHRGTGRDVALTFDDGPDPVWTNAVLDVLQRHRVRATFFCTGGNSSAHPRELARIVREGHLIGNHTWSHPFLDELSVDELRRQVDETWSVLDRAVELPQRRFFRPPYGSRTDRTLDWLGESGMITTLWDVAPDDWSMPGADEIVCRTVDAVTGGSIVLLHDGGGDRSQTVAALPGIIDAVRHGGAEPVRLDELEMAGA